MWLKSGKNMGNRIPSYSQQDATFLDLFMSKDALHVSGGSSPIIRSTQVYKQLAAVFFDNT